MTREEFENYIGDKLCIRRTPREDEYIDFQIQDSVTEDELIEILKTTYDYEKELLKEEKKIAILVRLKGLSSEKLQKVFSFALDDEDLCDPLMSLNIYNMIRTYNTISDQFFENDDIYVDDIEQLLDIKLNLRDKLLGVSRKLSVFFLSLLKYCSKTVAMPTDTITPVPNIYQTLLKISDVFMLSELLMKCQDIKMEECVLVNDSLKYLLPILEKTMTGMHMLNNFLKEGSK